MCIQSLSNSQEAEILCDFFKEPLGLRLEYKDKCDECDSYTLITMLLIRVVALFCGAPPISHSHEDSCVMNYNSEGQYM